MDCMVSGEKMKLGDMSIPPAAMGDGSTGAAVGVACRCPSVSSRGSPPSSTAFAVEKLAGAYSMDDVATGAFAGLPVSRCTTAMNSCGLAWTIFGVFSYTITGAAQAFLELVDGLDAGDEPRDEEDTFRGCGRGPRRPPFQGDDDDSEDGRMATVMVMLAASSPSLLGVTLHVSCSRFVCPTEYGALQCNAGRFIESDS
jgi:hypothetical protein